MATPVQGTRVLIGQEDFERTKDTSATFNRRTSDGSSTQSVTKCNLTMWMPDHYDVEAAPYAVTLGQSVDAAVATANATALNAALTAAAVDGGVVLLPAGYIEVDSTITVPSGASLRGIPRRSYIKAHSTFSDANGRLIQVGNTCSLEQFVVHVNGVDGVTGIYTEDWDDGVFRALSVLEATGYGIHINNDGGGSTGFGELEDLYITLGAEDAATSIGLFIDLHDDSNPGHWRGAKGIMVSGLLATGAGQTAYGIQIDGTYGGIVSGMYLSALTEGLRLGITHACSGLVCQGISLAENARLADASGNAAIHIGANAGTSLTLQGIAHVNGTNGAANDYTINDEISSKTAKAADIAMWTTGQYNTFLTDDAAHSSTLEGLVLRTYPLQCRSATFAADDATPSVSGGNVFTTANVNPTTITDFDDGVDGQFIGVLIGDANTTIDFTGTNLEGNSGADWSPSNGDALIGFHESGKWYLAIIDGTA